MSNTVIQIKNSSTVSAAPVTLAFGEIALNYQDEKLYFKNAGGTIKFFSTTGGTASPAGLNQEVQFNDSGSLGANASLTFNKSTETLSVKTIQFSDATTQNTAPTDGAGSASNGLIYAISRGMTLY